MNNPVAPKVAGRRSPTLPLNSEILAKHNKDHIGIFSPGRNFNEEERKREGSSFTLSVVTLGPI